MSTVYLVQIPAYTGSSYLASPVHGVTLHGNRCTAICEAHTNFADESVCLIANNV
jgi:hypothetical protein